ncbi:hypothetical protein ACHAPT_003967 [Fusarium lateritium]
MLTIKLLLLCFATLALAGPRRLVDAAIIGSGPAGISAAVTLAQQRLEVVIFDMGHGALDNGTWITRMPVPDEIREPNMLLPFMRKSLDGYGNVEQRYGQVLDIKRVKPGPRGFFRVNSEGGRSLHARRVLLAPGYHIEYPNILGYKDAWMKVLFNDPMSDSSKGHMGAYSAAVLARDESGSVSVAMYLAHQALRHVQTVTIYTDRNVKLGDDLARHLNALGSSELLKKIKVDPRRISSLHEIEVMNRKSSKNTAENYEIVIFFSDGKDVKHKFMFHRPRGKINVPFAEELNIRLGEGGLIKVDRSSMETMEKGVYAAGDCVSLQKTIIRSMFTGQLAAESIAMDIAFQLF